MTDPARRKSLRYEGFDYASPSGIFVTIATHERQELFGSSDEDFESLTPRGRTVLERWKGIPNRFKDVLIDDFVVMPDHIHGILWMGCADADPPTSCGDVVRWFKASVLQDYSVGVKQKGWRPYRGRLWQRSYYDHIIRGEKDLAAIRDYIDANPLV